MPFIEELGMQAATQATNNLVGGIMGLALGSINDRRQLKQQEKLQNLQIAGNKQMMDYSMQKQLEMWKNTNYGAQMEELKKAGLNPALLYGMSGGGGVTTGSPGGSVQGGQAPAGGGEVLQMAAMGIQLKGQEAEIKLKEAQARNLDADTANKPKTGAQIEATTLDLLQGVENKKAQEQLTKVETSIAKLEETLKTKSMDDVLSTISLQEEQAREQLDSMARQNLIDKATMFNKIDMVKVDLMGMWIRNALMQIQGVNIMQDTRVKEQEWQNLIQERVLKLRQDYRDSYRLEIDKAKQENDAFVNDLSQSTMLPVHMIEGAVNAILLRGLLSPGTAAPIKGFHQR